MKCGRMQKLKTDTISGLAGKVNESNFTIPNDDTFLPETVLFLTSNGEQKKTTEGYDFSTRDLKFMIKKTGWNKLYRTYNQSWETVSPRIYDLGNFSPLFTG